MSLRAIAVAEGVPERCLPQIFGELRRGGFVQSVRAAKGGFRLARSPEQISLLDLLRQLEGSLAEAAELRPYAAPGPDSDERPPSALVGRDLVLYEAPTESWASLAGRA